MVTPGETGGSNKNLLLIACSRNFGRTLSRILCRCGYCVQVSGSGEDALRQLGLNSYHAVISEVFLPGNVCGLTVLARVRKQYPNLPMIFLSEGNIKQLWEAIGPCAKVTCLPMPVDVDELKHAIAISTTQNEPVA